MSCLAVFPPPFTHPTLPPDLGLEDELYHYSIIEDALSSCTVHVGLQWESMPLGRPRRLSLLAQALFPVHDRLVQLDEDDRPLRILVGRHRMCSHSCRLARVCLITAHLNGKLRLHTHYLQPVQHTLHQSGRVCLARQLGQISRHRNMLRQRWRVECEHVWAAQVSSSVAGCPAARRTASHSSSPSTLRSSPSAGRPKQYRYIWVWMNCRMGIRRCSRLGS